MKRIRPLSYCPERDTEFCESRPDIVERTVLHDPLSDECIARFRRTMAFRDVTGLVEEPRIPSLQHCDIADYLRDNLDHTSQWFLHTKGAFGELKKIPFLLVEMYRYQPVFTPGFCSLQIPTEIGPYGGGPFDANIEYPAPVTSVLFTFIVRQRQLSELGQLLSEAAKKMPPWNSVSDEERAEAKMRFREGVVS